MAEKAVPISFRLHCDAKRVFLVSNEEHGRHQPWKCQSPLPTSGSCD